LRQARHRDEVAGLLPSLKNWERRAVQVLFNRIEKSLLWKGLIRIQDVVMTLVTFLVFVTLIASVFMRYVLKSDLYGIEEIIAVLAMWMYMLSASFASYENSHIKADILETYIKNIKVTGFLGIVVEIINVLVLGVFFYWSLPYAKWCIAAGTLSPYLKIPLLVSQISLSVGMFLMLFYSVYHLIKKIFLFAHGETEIVAEGGEEA